MGITFKANGLRPHSGICSKLALAGILGPIIFWSVSILLSLFQPGYSSFRHTLSALVLTPLGWIQTLDFCLLGLLVMLFTFGLYSGVQKRMGLKISLALVFLIGLGMLIIGIFPTDSGGGTLSLHGRIHIQTVRIIGLLFPIACFLMLPSLTSDPRWRGLDIYTGVTGVTVFILIIGWIAGTSAGWLDSWAGLYERIFTANAIIWLEIMAWRLLILPAGPEITKERTKNFLATGLGQDFWKYLGESGGAIYARLKSRPPAEIRKNNAVQTSKYIAFSVLLVMTLSGSRRKRKDVERPLKVHSPLSNTLIHWGMKGLGKHLGLSPVTNLALTMVRDEEHIK